MTVSSESEKVDKISGKKANKAIMPMEFKDLPR